MIDTGHLINSLISGAIQILNYYSLVVLIRVILSWVNIDSYNPFVRFLRGITDPLLDLIRSRLPNVFWNTGIDFTPLILILLIRFVVALLESLNI